MSASQLSTRDVLVHRQMDALLLEKQTLERKMTNVKERLKALKVDEVSLKLEYERAKKAKEATSTRPIRLAQEELHAWIAFRSYVKLFQ
ncbi:unnamed protein product [Nippostrongylus brasiliensis]|uniref:Uncharacterized protein n=1 Tax=Nippostrongylus brasiliensis TaxID=27835 RepID=A0A0N4YK79_NIPBR|nr:unnamed protein product [Nippostrongylus brasiliensis]